MNEIALIILQVLFITFIFNFSLYEITKKIQIKYDSIAARMNENYIAIKFNPELPGKYWTGTDSVLFFTILSSYWEL